MLARDATGRFVDIGIGATNGLLGCAEKGDYDVFTKLLGTQVGTWLDQQIPGLHASPPPTPRKQPTKM